MIRENVKGVVDSRPWQWENGNGERVNRRYGLPPTICRSRGKNRSVGFVATVLTQTVDVILRRLITTAAHPFYER